MNNLQNLETVCITEKFINEWRDIFTTCLSLPISEPFRLAVCSAMFAMDTVEEADQNTWMELQKAFQNMIDIGLVEFSEGNDCA